MSFLTLITRAILFLLAAGVAACTAQPPNVVTPPDNGDPMRSRYADVILGVTIKDFTMSCTDGGVPVCGSMPTAQPGVCGDNPALGPPDNTFFTVQPLGRIELGFLCSTILETGLSATGTASDDFVVHGSVLGDGVPVVEISQDATMYTAVNYWPQVNGAYVTDPGFQLEVPMAEAARFVRISETSGNGMIQIDAVEALPRPQ